MTPTITDNTPEYQAEVSLMITATLKDPISPTTLRKHLTDTLGVLTTDDQLIDTELEKIAAETDNPSYRLTLEALGYAPVPEDFTSEELKTSLEVMASVEVLESPITASPIIPSDDESINATALVGQQRTTPQNEERQLSELSHRGIVLS